MKQRLDIDAVKLMASKLVETLGTGSRRRIPGYTDPDPDTFFAYYTRIRIQPFLPTIPGSGSRYLFYLLYPDKDKGFHLPYNYFFKFKSITFFSKKE